MNKLIVFMFISMFLTFGCSAEKKDAEPKSNAVAILVQEKLPVTSAKVKKETVPLVTFVELGSLNCTPCKMMKKVMEEVEADYKEKVKIIFYDVWTKEGKPFGAKYGISVIPTQVFLDKDGKEFFRHEGYFPKEDIDTLLAKHGVKK